MVWVVGMMPFLVSWGALMAIEPAILDLLIFHYPDVKFVAVLGFDGPNDEGIWVCFDANEHRLFLGFRPLRKPFARCIQRLWLQFHPGQDSP